MTYDAALAFIRSTLKFGSKLGLETIGILLERLGNPQKKLKCVHVAGTNGKGSTSAFLSHILKNAGYKTGLYTSPFIYEFNERIQIDNQNIPDGDFVDCVGAVKRAIERMVAEGKNHPTEFEIITAAAFLYFARQACDVAIAEVGMGGRFDATNVIEKPLLSVITKISFDHMEYLGDTLGKIAFEKCGIIKEGAPCLSCAAQDAAARAVIERIADERKSPLFYSRADKITRRETGLSGTAFSYKSYEDLKIPLLGAYQVENAVTAIEAAEFLRRGKSGFAISDEAIYSGLLETEWPGRLEVIGEKPLFILDGSHNFDGVCAFCESARLYAEGKRKIFIFGMLRDKEYEKAIEKIAPLADVLIATDVASPRAQSAAVLAETAKKYLPAETVFALADNEKAVEKALSLAGAGDAVFAVGSLYMLRNIKAAFLNV
jgi:dihydrofolate synthase/folylpolyglutamate synthase